LYINNFHTLIVISRNKLPGFVIGIASKCFWLHNCHVARRSTERMPRPDYINTPLCLYQVVLCRFIPQRHHLWYSKQVWLKFNRCHWCTNRGSFFSL